MSRERLHIYKVDLLPYDQAPIRPHPIRSKAAVPILDRSLHRENFIFSCIFRFRSRLGSNVQL